MISRAVFLHYWVPCIFAVPQGELTDVFRMHFWPDVSRPHALSGHGQYRIVLSLRCSPPFSVYSLGSGMPKGLTLPELAQKVDGAKRYRTHWSWIRNPPDRLDSPLQTCAKFRYTHRFRFPQRDSIKLCTLNLCETTSPIMALCRELRVGSHR
jgi:hypothetical protein